MKTKLPDHFREIQVKFSRFYAHVLNKADISISQYALLNQLTNSKEMPMTEVGEKLHITKPAVTHLVDRLEKFKLLKRVEHPTDRRVFLIKISPKGRRVTRQIQSDVLKIVSKALNQFKANEQKIIVEYQKSISNVIDCVLDPSNKKQK